MLSDQEKEQILSELPNIKLSYENIIHKKVYSNFVLAIPEGKKCFAWFTNTKNGNVCYILELKENKQVYDIKIVNCCFNSCLSYGTIFYGTVFYHLGNNFFSIEDIFFYKGVNVSNYTWIKKLDLFDQVMNIDIKQVAYNRSFMVFGLPLIRTNFEELVNEINNLKYKIKCIQFRNYNNKNVSQYLEFINIYKFDQDFKQKSYENKNDKNKDKEDIEYKPVTISKQTTNTNIKTEPKNSNKRERLAVFQIKPEIQNDIYYLYCYDNISGSLVHYNIAYIPDFKTSVMMNKLFRNIKENSNLDLLEESDNEDEFENEKEDRFVYLDREFNMLCSYNYKFKKWVPLKLADKNMKIISLEKVSP
jgi:hypothetical protein